MTDDHMNSCNQIGLNIETMTYSLPPESKKPLYSAPSVC